MPVNVVKTCRREALCVFYPLIYFFIDSWKAESCHRGMTLDVFFSINNCRKNNMQRYNQSVNILLCLKMHFTLFLLQWVLAEQCVDQVVGTDKIDYFVVKIDVSIRHIQCNLKMRRTHTKKMQTAVNIYNDWSADDFVNNMTVRDLILNHIEDWAVSRY